MLSKKRFKCSRCGECCKKYTIKLFNTEIKRISEKGYSAFYEFDDGIKSDVLKKVNGKCVFLRGTKGRYICSVYDIRPRICRQYPFFGKKVESCRPVTVNSLLQSK